MVPFSSVMENAMPGGYVGSRPKDESKLSQEPRQIRNRIRRNAKKNAIRDGRIERDIEMLYKKPIAEWDLEELARGRPRTPAGNFQGGVPKWITPVILAEAKKRLLTETFGQMAAHVDLAIRTVVKVMNDEEVDDKGKPTTDSRTKLTAAMFVIEHITGKPKAIVEVDAADFTKSVLASAIMLDDGMPQGHLAIEGEFTVDDEEEWDDDDTGSE